MIRLLNQFTKKNFLNSTFVGSTKTRLQLSNVTHYSISPSHYPNIPEVPRLEYRTLREGLLHLTIGTGSRQGIESILGWRLIFKPTMIPSAKGYYEAFISQVLTVAKHNGSSLP